MKAQLFLLSIFLLCLTYSQVIINYSDDKNILLIPDEDSPCLRPCTSNASSFMECSYKFIVENYQSLSRACHDCPFNQSDCLRPHCIPADGTSRSIIAVNRRMPGPAIQVCEGDIIKVLVENHLTTEETTIHWHGHHQVDTPYMDGVPYLTQCPISTGTGFHYHFKAEHPGTLFWHSHSGNQRGDGVYGALIIRQSREKDPHNFLYDYDLPEHVMVITDWVPNPVQNLFTGNFHNGGRVPITTLLVNGLGYFKNTTSKSGIPPARFYVEKGYNYRFRIINAEFMMCPIEISVDNHTMIIISTDGFDVEPITVSSFISYSGERFDFIISTTEEIGNYWIRLRGAVSCTRTKAHQVAVLSYSGADSDLPEGEPDYTFRREDGLQLNSVNAEMLKNNSVSIPELNALHANDESLKEIPDKKFYVHYDFYNISNTNLFVPGLYNYNEADPRFKSKTPQLNHISFAFQSFPLLSQREQIKAKMFCNESTERDCEKEFCQCTHVLQVKLKDVVEVVLIDVGKVGDANHPFHLHGYAFRVIGMERIGTSVEAEDIKKLDEHGLLKRKLDRAPWKDTVTVPDGGYTVIRFHATNPGYWLFHCHIDFHAAVGMALVFKVGEHQNMLPVPENFPTCGSWQ